MANPNFSMQGWVARLLSNARRAGSDGALSDPTGGRVGTNQEPYLVFVAGQGREMLADEGSYFTAALTGTPGTGISNGAAVTGYVATTPFLIVQNNEPSGGKSVTLDYIRATLTAGAGSATNLRATTEIDQIARYTSGATSIINAPGATNGSIASPRTSLGAPVTVAIYGGPLTAAAAGQNRKFLATNLAMRTAIPVIGDTWLLKFGTASGDGTGAALNGAVPSAFVLSHGPVVIDPGHCFLWNLWAAAQVSAGAYEVDIGGWLR